MELSVPGAQSSNFGYSFAAGARRSDDFGPVGTSGRSVLVVADRDYVGSEIVEDARLAGYSASRQLDYVQAGDLIASAGSAPAFHADLIIVDCPWADGPMLSVLEHANTCVSKGTAELIVSTSIGSLDEVYSCLDQPAVQILVTPTRADRMIAIGRALGSDGNRVRELPESSRVELLRLTEQVSEIAQQLEALSTKVVPSEDQRPAFRFGSSDGERHTRMARTPLPDPRLVRKIVRQRRLRSRFFDGDLFADPAWDMLLDLTAARAEHARVSVSSLCIASGVPTTTALRWITQLTHAGLIERVEDDADRRRAFLSLSDQAALAMSRYFAELGQNVIPAI